MILLRAFLLLGLIIHKLVWERMKLRLPRESQKPMGWNLSIKSIVKLGKIGLLLFLIAQTIFWDIFPILSNPLLLRGIGLVIYISGLAVAIAGRIQLGDNWANLEDGQVSVTQILVQTGIYKYIRHPIYIGDLLLVLGLELALDSYLVLLVIPVGLVVLRQALAEEALLIHVFPGYSLYRQRTKMFIPYVL